MLFRFALPSPTVASNSMFRASCPGSFASRVRNGLLVSLLSCAGLATAHPGAATGLRALSWSGLVGQADNAQPVESLKPETLRKHAIGEQNIVGDGSQQTFDVFSDPNAALPSELNFEGSFLLEIPEAADRESLERRHDEHG
jgi:hypothetical protein